MEHQTVENKIYNSILVECENIRSSLVGIHPEALAFKMAIVVSIALLPKQQRKIFDVLTREYQTTKEIAKKVNMDSRVVSTQLKQLEQKTILIKAEIVSRRRSKWCRVFV